MQSNGGNRMVGSLYETGSGGLSLPHPKCASTIKAPKAFISETAARSVALDCIGTGDFLGEACLTGQTVHLASATAIVPGSILRIEKHEMLRVLQEQPALSCLFISYLLSRNMRVEEDLVDPCW